MHCIGSSSLPFLVRLSNHSNTRNDTEGYLNERYSLLWLTTGDLLVLSLSINWLKPIALFVGFQIVSNALFFAGIIFLVIIALGLTVAISNLSERNKKLTQELHC